MEKKTRPMIAVGGSLHGVTVAVPEGCTAIYTDHGLSHSVDLAPPDVPGTVILASHGTSTALTGKALAAFRAAERFELYRVRYRGWVGLLISAQLLGTADKPKGLDQTIVEALGIAAGVWREPQPLVDVDALQRAEINRVRERVERTGSSTPE